MNVIKVNHYGEPVLAKQVVVAPDGRTVEKHPDQPLKAGWRLMADEVALVEVPPDDADDVVIDSE